MIVICFLLYNALLRADQQLKDGATCISQLMLRLGHRDKMTLGQMEDLKLLQILTCS